MLTRQEMERVIASGGSVLYGGRILTRIEELPTVAELAKTEKEKAAAQGDLQQQMNSLQRQMDSLKAPPVPERGSQASEEPQGDEGEPGSVPEKGEQHAGRRGHVPK